MVEEDGAYGFGTQLAHLRPEECALQTESIRMIVNGSADWGYSNPLFLSAIEMMMRKSGLSPKTLSEELPLRDFMGRFPDLDVNA